METYTYTIKFEDESTLVLENIARLTEQVATLVDGVSTSLGSMNQQMASLFNESKGALDGLSTAISTSNTNTVELAEAMGEQLTPAIGNLSEQAEKLQATLDTKDKVKLFGEMAKEASNLIGIFGEATGASSSFSRVLTSLSQGASAFGSTVSIVNGINKAFNLTLKATPLGWIVGGLAVVTSAIGLFSSKKEEATLQSNAHATKLIEERDRVNELVEELKKSETPYERKVELLEELKKINPDIVEGIDAEKEEYGKLAENVAEYNTQLSKEIEHKIRLDGLNKKKSAAEEAESALGQAEYELGTLFNRVAVDVLGDENISGDRKIELEYILKNDNSQAQLAELIEKWSSAWGLSGAKDSYKMQLYNLLGEDGFKHYKKYEDSLAAASKNRSAAAEQHKEAQEAVKNQQEADKYGEGYRQKQAEIAQFYEQNPQFFPLFPGFNTTKVSAPVGLEGDSQTGTPEVFSTESTAVDKRTPNGLAVSETSTPVTTPTPSTIPGAENTTANVISGGTAQRIININVSKFQDAVNNYFNGEKDVEGKVSSFMDMMNEGWMRILNSANQMT